MLLTSSINSIIRSNLLWGEQNNSDSLFCTNLFNKNNNPKSNNSSSKSKTKLS